MNDLKYFLKKNNPLNEGMSEAIKDIKKTIKDSEKTVKESIKDHTKKIEKICEDSENMVKSTMDLFYSEKFKLQNCVKDYKSIVDNSLVNIQIIKRTIEKRIDNADLTVKNYLEDMKKSREEIIKQVKSITNIDEIIKKYIEDHLFEIIIGKIKGLFKK